MPEKPKALIWVDEAQLAARIVRKSDPGWSDIMEEVELVEFEPLNTIIDETLKQKGQHVRRR